MSALRASPPDGGLFGGRLFRFQSLPSTNTWALRQAGSLRNGDVVFARRQTGGRGRLGRRWFSAGSRGLAVSIVLRVPPHREWTAELSGMIGALAVRAALARFGLQAALKWPNDVLAGGRKIAGLLAERDGTDGLLILGIGVNVNLTRADFARHRPRYPATSLRIETGREHNVEQVLSALLGEFARQWRQALGGARRHVLAQWRRHDAFVGRPIEILAADGVLRGRYAGVNGEGLAVLRAADGTGITVSAGDLLSGGGHAVQPALARRARS